MKAYVHALFAALLISSGNTALARSDLRGEEVLLSGDVVAHEDVSAVAAIGSRFVAIATDEAVGDKENENTIQLLRPRGEGFEVHRSILLLEGDDEDGKEMDIEAMAAEGSTLYVAGSHSSRRSKTKASRLYEENRRTFHADQIDDERNRDWLYRLVLDDQGKEKARNRISLRELVARDPVLQAFNDIPSKENGVDIEGLAVKDGQLYVGFRGPVLRENFVPVLKFEFDNPTEGYELLYVELGGRGIRGMASVSDGLLIIAGPVGGGPGSYQLYHWDGTDSITGSDRAGDEGDRIQLLGDIRPPKKGKAEGVTVLREDGEGYELLVVYDGVKKKRKIMQRFQVSKTQ